MPACGWEISGCQNCSTFMNMDPELQVEVEAWSINRLWEWTNRRFGPCEVSYRPCRKRCYNFAMGFPFAGRGFLNLNCDRCGDDCSCKSVSGVILPGPIAEPTEILIDGDPLDLSGVIVYDYNNLVRVDGGHFPTCQDMGALPDELDTWQVTYLQGEPVPPGGSIVAGILACEYAKYLCNDPSCQLPKRVTSITRQGITMAMLDNFQNLENGFTGIWAIDDWIAAAIKPPARSVVYTPDVPRPKQMTWSFSESS